VLRSALLKALAALLPLRWRYRDGQADPEVDPRWYGHIPGAKNLPMTLLGNDVGPIASLFDTETQRRTHELLGVDAGAPPIHRQRPASDTLRDRPKPA
jgi:hypothetical protein